MKVPISIQPRPAGPVGFDAAMESPCLTCSTSPCCTHLPLPGFPVENLMQLDHARWLLGFDGIELGISASGDWSVFLSRPCRYLDLDSYGCTLHGQPDQPRICQHYNPYTCWYKRALTGRVSPDFLQIDRRRLEMLVPLVQFDDERNLVAVPTWDALHELYADVPVAEPSPEQIAPDPVLAEWRNLVTAPAGQLVGRPLAIRPVGETLGDDRCTGCAAYCCENLQFFVDPPTTASSVDYLRFALGFQGVTLGIADDGWSLLVQSRCRHLADGRCSIYGSPERPLRCRYFDAQQCPYPVLLGEPRPPGFVRIGIEELPVVEALVGVDEYGAVGDLPSAELVRAAVEESWAG